MQKKWTRLSAVLLIFCLLFSLTAFALDEEPPAETEPQAETQQTEVPEETPEETLEPVETQTLPEKTEPTGTEPEAEPDEGAELTDEELIEKYHIPDSWARRALIFAVRNGILFGTDDGTLSPGKNATRAEIATILSRLLPTEHCEDLSGYSDMNDSKWYYVPMTQAVAMGLISGTGSTTMSPNANATREQAFVMIARAFGVPAGTQASVSRKFGDWNQASRWAIPYLATLTQRGVISGSGGYINPKQDITRQEFAQILYGMIDRISDTIPEQTDGMTVCTAQELFEGTVITGSLLLCSDVTSLSLENITVKGSLILQGVDLLELTIDNCSIGELALCRPTDLNLLQSDVKFVSVLDGESTLSGTDRDVSVGADTVLCGTAETVTLCGGDLTVAEGASAVLLQAGSFADGSAVTVDGSVAQAEIEADLTLTGSGSVSSATVRTAEFSPEPVVEDCTFIQDFGLSALTAHGKMEGSLPTPKDPARTLTMTFDGQLPLGTCDIEWSINGKFYHRNENVALNDTPAVSYWFDFTPFLCRDTECTVTVEVYYRDRTERYAFTVSIRQPNIIYDAAQVKTLDVPATVRYTTKLYANSDLTGELGTVNSGTTVIYKAYRDTFSAKIQLPNGNSGWVDYAAIRILQGSYYTTKDYSSAVKEDWINTQGYSSSTKYLIWCNLYTQRINIFTGSKGNWKLIYSCQCASGANSTPTPQQVSKILYKTGKWEFGSYYVHHISVFDYDRGFHSMLYCYDSYTLYNTVMGRPASHGCVRVPDEGIYYIWNNVPVNSTVVIY